MRCPFYAVIVADCMEHEGAISKWQTSDAAARMAMKASRLNLTQ
jgi:hypothetical protein